MARPAIVAERAGIPSAIVTGTSFVNLTGQLAKAERVPGLRTAEYPGVFSVESEAEIRRNIEKMTFDRIIDALTEPVDNSGVKSATVSNPEEIVSRMRRNRYNDI